MILGRLVVKQQRMRPSVRTDEEEESTRIFAGGNRSPLRLIASAAAPSEGAYGIGRNERLPKNLDVLSESFSILLTKFPVRLEGTR